MGVDAFVYCNCFRAGKLRELPPESWEVYLEENGSVCCNTQILKEQIAFDEWLALRACEHQDGVLKHHRFGNIALIALLRSELNLFPNDFPILLNQVLYDGTHSGDYLCQEDINRLQLELDRLKSFKCTDSELQAFVDNFRLKMEQLVNCAKIVNNPIAF